MPGNPTWSYYYRKLIRLSPEVSCDRADHVGCGLSDKPQDYVYTLGTHPNLEALIANLELQHIGLVVHDWGGAIGMGYAARHRMPLIDCDLNTSAFYLPAFLGSETSAQSHLGEVRCVGSTPLPVLLYGSAWNIATG